MVWFLIESSYSIGMDGAATIFSAAHVVGRCDLRESRIRNVLSKIFVSVHGTGEHSGIWTNTSFLRKPRIVRGTRIKDIFSFSIFRNLLSVWRFFCVFFDFLIGRFAACSPHRRRAGGACWWPPKSKINAKNKHLLFPILSFFFCQKRSSLSKKETIA